MLLQVDLHKIILSTLAVSATQPPPLGCWCAGTGPLPSLKSKVFVILAPFNYFAPDQDPDLDPVQDQDQDQDLDPDLDQDPDLDPDLEQDLDLDSDQDPDQDPDPDLEKNHFCFRLLIIILLQTKTQT